jgi:hypothetical protein
LQRKRKEAVARLAILQVESNDVFGRLYRNLNALRGRARSTPGLAPLAEEMNANILRLYALIYPSCIANETADPR